LFWLPGIGNSAGSRYTYPMPGHYFNHHSQIMGDWWDRWSFIRQWWRLYGDDPKLAPPYYPTLRRALEPARNPHLARLSPLFVKTEALPRRRTPSPYGLDAAGGDQPVAMSVLLADPRREDRTAYLSLLRCRNDADSFKKHFEFMMELLGSRGYSRVIGPIGLSPHLEAGLLQDSWNVIPPLHTPYAPPYLPEILESRLRPLARSQLYHLDIPPELPPAPPAWAKLAPLDPQRLATDLLPLLVTAIPTRPDFPPPDAAEAAFLLRWWGQGPLLGWLAEVGAQPVGFTLFQPDLSPRLRLAKGGRNLLWRVWLNWPKHRPTQHGRVLFGTVLPPWQGQGIGQQLLHQVQQTAQQQGWRSLIFGPFPMTAPTAKFIKRCGAKAQQSYLLYQKEL